MTSACFCAIFIFIPFFTKSNWIELNLTRLDSDHHTLGSAEILVHLRPTRRKPNSVKFIGFALQVNCFHIQTTYLWIRLKYGTEWGKFKVEHLMGWGSFVCWCILSRLSDYQTSRHNGVCWRRTNNMIKLKLQNNLKKRYR